MTGNVSAEPILDLIQAFRRSKVMFTAVRLGIFDQLAAGAQTAEQLAAALALHPGACARLLHGCVSLGLLVHDASGFHNTPVSTKYLVTSSPDTLSGYILYSDQSLYPLWGHLDDAVRQGSNRWTQVFGSRQALFDHYFRDNTSAGAFLRGMHGFGQLSSTPVVTAFDLSRFRHLVDLGGATGHLAIAACQAYPELRATVLDLPRVEPFARAVISKSPVASRIEFVAGDFFADDLPPADLYCLGRILHDWADDRIQALVEKIFRTLPAGGALLIGETLLDDDRFGPVASLMQDLNMLVCADGRERTPDEYRTLLESAGFAHVDFHKSGSVLDAILAIKNRTSQEEQQTDQHSY